MIATPRVVFIFKNITEAKVIQYLFHVHSGFITKTKNYFSVLSQKTKEFKSTKSETGRLADAVVPNRQVQSTNFYNCFAQCFGNSFGFPDKSAREA